MGSGYGLSHPSVPVVDRIPNDCVDPPFETAFGAGAGGGGAVCVGGEKF